MTAVEPTGALPRWRPLPGKGPAPSRVGDMLDRTLRSMGTPSVAGVELLFERWGEVVGDSMAARTVPVRIDGETLVVSCDEPAIATHVRYLQSELVDRLAQLSGERRITRIDTRVAQVRRGPRPPRRTPRRA
ncbi:MAG TPA: DUF721 domain-containing protein [Acidimicrobiales bacterium]|nr:DUF721 domain-containing protein [Acidimicrobiales bacterium]